MQEMRRACFEYLRLGGSMSAGKDLHSSIFSAQHKPFPWDMGGHVSAVYGVIWWCFLGC